MDKIIFIIELTCNGGQLVLDFMIITAGGCTTKIDYLKTQYGKNFYIPIHNLLGNITTIENLVHAAKKVQAIFSCPKLFMWRYFKNH